MGFNLDRAAKGLATGGLSELDRAFGGGGGGVNMSGYNRAVNKSMKGINEGYDLAQAGYDPFMATTTAAGMGSGISELINSGTYRNLVGERANTMQDYLGGVGLSRSGYGVNEMADLSQDTLLGLEGLLSDRKLQGAQSIGGLHTGRAGDIAGMLTGGAAANLGAQQQQTANECSRNEQPIEFRWHSRRCGFNV